MFVRSLVLRLLLAVALVFNGVAPAVAAIHAGPVTAPRGAMESPAMADEAMPCHGQLQAAADVPPPSVPDDEASPDCCKSGVCRCACMHSTPVTIPDPGLVALLIGHAESVRPMPSGHDDAAWPHLIRPPIG